MTERILSRELDNQGIHVHRPYKVIGMQGDPAVEGSILVSFENGASIRTRYVIGADGSHSVVCLKLDFASLDR